MSGTTWITAGALYAAALATLTVGWWNYHNTKRTLQTQRQLAAAEHQHQRQLAIDNQIFERRAASYMEAVKLLHGMVLKARVRPPLAWSSNPLADYAADPPPDLLASLSVVGSPDAAALFEDSYLMLYNGVRRSDPPGFWEQKIEGSPVENEDAKERRLRASAMQIEDGTGLYEQLRRLSAHEVQSPSPERWGT